MNHTNEITIGGIHYQVTQTPTIGDRRYRWEMDPTNEPPTEIFRTWEWTGTDWVEWKDIDDDED